MNSKEVCELRKRMRQDRTNMTTLHGCFVSDSQQIISTFSQSFATMPETEIVQYADIFRRTLLGSIGKNLLNMSFGSTDTDEYKLLFSLRESQLHDDNLVQTLYEKIVASYPNPDEKNYVILLAEETFDIPAKSLIVLDQDDTDDCNEEDSTFHYFICSICPVPLREPAMEYLANQKKFHNAPSSQIIGKPASGFLFPAYDDRCTNVNAGIFFCKDSNVDYADLIRSVFAVDIHTTAEEQKSTFENILTNSLQSECSFSVVQSLYESLSDKITVAENDCDTPCEVGKSDIHEALETAGVSSESIQKFDHAYDQSFGDKYTLPVANIVNRKKFEISTPSVTVRAAPDASGLISTKMIDGELYILISAASAPIISINGIAIKDKRFDGQSSQPTISDYLDMMDESSSDGIPEDNEE